MKILILLSLISFMAAGCATYSMTYCDLLDDMHKNKVLTQAELRNLKAQVAPHLIKFTYQEWESGQENTLQQESLDNNERKIDEKILNYLINKAKMHANEEVSSKDMLDALYFKKLIDKKPYLEEQESIRKEEGACNVNEKFEDHCNHFLSKINNNALTQEARNLYVRMYAYTFKKWHEEEVRQQNLALALQGLGRGLSGAAAALSAPYQSSGNNYLSSNGTMYYSNGNGNYSTSNGQMIYAVGNGNYSTSDGKMIYNTGNGNYLTSDGKMIYNVGNGNYSTSDGKMYYRLNNGNYQSSDGEMFMRTN